MKIVFFGTPDYVIPVLDALHKEFKSKNGDSPTPKAHGGIVAVVTQSPKPVGRTKKVEYSAVDTWAHKKKIPVYFDSTDLIKDGVEADLGVVAAYGSMIPDDVLSYFPNGLLNIHPSNLPEFRGASPVHAMILTGKQEATVSIMKVDTLMDHGQIVTQFKETISDDDTTEGLRARLFERASDVLLALIPAYLHSKINLKEQDHKKATFTRLIKKNDGFIPFDYVIATMEGKELDQDWEIPFIYTKNEDKKIPYTLHPTPSTLERFIRTMNPWPGAWTQIKIVSDKDIKILRLKILEAHVEKLVPDASCLVPDIVQLEGKNPVSWKQFKEAYSDIFS
jgi:methionyl-tRNA formyltransferase